jgi:hypothetical protein
MRLPSNPSDDPIMCTVEPRSRPLSDCQLSMLMLPFPDKISTGSDPCGLITAMVSTPEQQGT